MALPRAAVSACCASAAATAPLASELTRMGSAGLAVMMLIEMISTPYCRVTACTTGRGGR